jgi:drug/metabolite transporter (DMT)-like permease
MFTAHLGELAALTTAICWTITSICFEAAAKKVGSLSVNFIRLIIAFFLLGIFTFFTRGMFLPMDAAGRTWLWLFISGIIGFIIGDLFLVQAFVDIGSRISLLIMSSAPPITAIIGYLIMGERLTLFSAAGMFIAVFGIAMVVLCKTADERRIEFSHPAKGVAYAFIGALGQAFGLVFSKLGMGTYDPFAATQIRVIAAIAGFAIIITVSGNWGKLRDDLKDHSALKYTGIGSVFGPFLGVSFSLMAVQYTATGIVSTISSISPILIIPVSIVLFKEKVPSKEILGAVVSIIGVSMLFI